MRQTNYSHRKHLTGIQLIVIMVMGWTHSIAIIDGNRKENYHASWEKEDREYL